MYPSTLFILLSFSVTLNGHRQDAVAVQVVSFREEEKHENPTFHRAFKLTRKEMTGCREPVDAVIELEDESGMHTIMPKRVMVKRCLGNCYNLLSCMPMSTKKREIAVARSHLANGKKTYGWVTVEDHVNCMCECTVTKEDCGTENHMYDAMNCNCFCMNMGEREECSAYGKLWDNPTCSCNCRNQTTTDCSSGQTFNKDTCLCV